MKPPNKKGAGSLHRRARKTAANTIIAAGSLVNSVAGRTAIKSPSDGSVGASYAGRTSEKDLTAPGLTKAGAGNGKPKRKRKFSIVAAYDYRDEANELLFQVCRTDTKEFPLRRPDPLAPDKWIWNIEGARRVPFHLPQLIAAVKEARPVFVAEGEKDVLALEKAGFAATCNPCGAGKWQEDYAKYFLGAEVIVIADKDDTGREHAGDVARKLQGTAATIKVLELPDVEGKPVKDAHDFFAAGANAADLDELTSAAPHWNGASVGLTVSGQDVHEPEDLGSELEPPSSAGADPQILILPSGDVSISESARAIFKKIAPSRTIFWRGGTLAELTENEGVASLDLIKPDALRSRVERFGLIMAWRTGSDGRPVLKPARMSRDIAAAIMAATEARELLPPVATVLRCPILVDAGEGAVAVLGEGYHPEHGGQLVVAGEVPPQVPLAESVGSLRWLMEEFHFQTDGDYSRALAALVTPALRIGGHLRGNFPVDVAEADQSQSGKGYRHTLISTLYNEASYFVTCRSGGVGSVDESLAAALMAGRPFICLDNLRGRMESQHLEAFLTCPSLFPARIPHRGEVQIDPKRFLLQMSSNGLEATRDLVNRASICRIRKRPGFQYRDTLGELQRRQPYFLGCVFAVIGEWIAAGKPRTTDTRHDFREWCQSLDWIVQNVFRCAPLMDGHQAAQDRASNPALSLLRAVALATEREGRLDVGMIAGELVELCTLHEIDVPGLREPDDDKAKKQVGILMRRCFKDADTVAIDGFTITRTIRQQYRSEGGPIDIKTYTISKP